MRPVRDTVMAILHFVAAALYLPWIAMHLLVLLVATRISGLGGGIPALFLSLVLHGLATVGLVVAAVGLLRQAPWGRTLSLGYAVLAGGGALLLWLTGARAWFVTLLLLYPLLVLYVFLRPPEPPPREEPTAPASDPGPEPPGGGAT